jgi:hypothetical protein
MEADKTIITAPKASILGIILAHSFHHHRKENYRFSRRYYAGFDGGIRTGLPRH